MVAMHRCSICAGALAVAALTACNFGSPRDKSIAEGGCGGAAAVCLSETMLRECTDSDVNELDCGWGCFSDGAHCGVLVPAGGVITADDFAAVGLMDVVIAGTSTTINADTGDIMGVRGEGEGVLSGIDFQLRGEAAVFRMKSLHTTGTVMLKGNRAVVIIAQERITIDSIVDGRGDPVCDKAGQTAGPGGYDGGDGEMTALGPGGGAGTMMNNHGGGGGAHGDLGGVGGGVVGSTAAAGGAAFGTSEIVTLRGGGGGGGGGGGTNAGTGGGGGAAIQLAAGRSIEISAAGGINAGGCGGDAGGGINDAGGGGGAGGTILLEAPTITIAGALAVNGGGGGTLGALGANATLTRDPAPGGMAPNQDDGDGGAGGAANRPRGQPAGPVGTNGGGGGAVGRMRFHTKTGEVTVQAGAVLSPALDDAPTTTTQGRAGVQ